MERSLKVRIYTDDLLDSFSAYLDSILPSLRSLKEHRKLKNKGSFSFDTSHLNKRGRGEVLSFAEEKLYNSYIFKVKYGDYGTVYYERAINGITVSVLKLAVVLGCLVLATGLLGLGYWVLN